MIEVFTNLFVFQLLNADSNMILHKNKVLRSIIFSLVCVGLFFV